MLSASSLASAPIPTTEPSSTVSPTPIAGGVQLLAQLTDSTSGGATGWAQYNQVTLGSNTVTTFGVQVHDAPADDTFTVTLDGVVVGQFTTDANGNGGLLLTSNPASAAANSLPADFPTGVAAGTAVSLTDSSGATTLTGELETPPTPPLPPAPPLPNGVMLTAQLTGTGTTAIGLAQYNQTTITAMPVNGGVSTAIGTTPVTITTFLVQIQGAPADDTLSVSIDGVDVGSITTDAKGNGALFLSSNPVNGTQSQLPADFPTDVAAGTAITVTDASGATSLSGSLATATPPPPGGKPQPVANGACLTAQLSDTTNTSDTAVGTVQLNQVTQNGVTNTLFVVQVHGAPANDTLSVAIAGVVVGSITTDANGNGGLVLSSHPQNKNQQLLPANFPTSLTTGAEVTVSDTSGATSLAGTLSTGPVTPWHNPTNPFDVLGDGGPVVPRDALVEIQYLNSGASSTLSTTTTSSPYFLDVLGNNEVVPLDALRIIQYLNTNSQTAGSGGAASSSAMFAADSGSSATGSASGSTDSASASGGASAGAALLAAAGGGVSAAASNAPAQVPVATLVANSTSSSTSSPTTTASPNGPAPTGSPSLRLAAFSSGGHEAVDAALSDAAQDWIGL